MPYAGTPLNVASEDWAYNPGKSAQSLDNVLAQKAKNLSGELKNIVKNDLKNYEWDRNLYVWQKNLDEMLDAVSKKEVIKEKVLQVRQIGVIKSDIFEFIKQYKPEIQAEHICLYQNVIWHILRDTKPKIKEPNMQELKSIVAVLDEAKHCYYDTGHQNLIYYYPSSQEDKMLNYVAVDLNYELKKFKTSNFVVSVGKIPFVNFKTTLKKRDKKGEKIFLKVK